MISPVVGARFDVLLVARLDHSVLPGDQGRACTVRRYHGDPGKPGRAWTCCVGPSAAAISALDGTHPTFTRHVPPVVAVRSSPALRPHPGGDGDGVRANTPTPYALSPGRSANSCSSLLLMPREEHPLNTSENHNMTILYFHFLIAVKPDMKLSWSGDRVTANRYREPGLPPRRQRGGRSGQFSSSAHSGTPGRTSGSGVPVDLAEHNVTECLTHVGVPRGGSPATWPALGLRVNVQVAVRDGSAPTRWPIRGSPI